MNYLDIEKYIVLVKLTDDAETHALLDRIHYLNDIFKEKESAMDASFVTDDVFEINGIESKEEAHKLVEFLKCFWLKDFNIPNIERFNIMHFCCNVEEVIENE